MKKVWQKTPAWITYSVLFVALICVLVGCLFMTGRSMIWELDGLAQHYPILVQFRHMIISFLNNPSGGFTHWAWNISLGSDQLTNFSYYVVGDLFNYLIILFPKSQIETGFAFLVFLRMYASGLAFLLYASTYKFKKFSKVVGAVAYTFNGYALATGLHHPFFILPLIFFPLLCYGIDRVLTNKSWLPLIFAVFLVFLGNFYFAWILGIGAIFYTLIKGASLWKHPDFHFFKSLGKLIVSVVLGLGMSAIVFIPTIILATGSTRITDNFANGLKVFPPEYYLNIIDSILPTGRAMNFWLVIGISSVSFLGLVYMLRHFKTYLWNNIGLVIVCIGILIPAFGAVMNALSTPSNRWVLLGNIIFGIATVIFMDNLDHFTRRDVGWFAGAGALLIVLVWASNGFLMNLQRHDFVTYGFLLATVIVVLCAFFFNWSSPTKKLIILSVFMLNIGSNIIGIYSPNASNLAIQQMNRDLPTRFEQDYFNGANNYLKDQPGFFRTSKAPRYHYNEHLQNLANYTNTNTDLSMNTGVNDESVYLTLQNGYLGKFSQAVGNSQFSMNTPIAQGDYRTAFNDLLGVKYIFAKANTKKAPTLPYGYKPVRDKSGKIKTFEAKPRVNAVPAIENMDGTAIYKTNNALPLVYSQTKTVSPSQFNQLNAVDRERVMTQGAVVNKDQYNTNPLTYKSPSHHLKYKVQVDETKVIDSGRQLTKYRLGILGDQDADKVIDQPHAQVSLSANLQKTKALLETNKMILENNKYENKNGLKKMTSDVTGKPFDYSLTINKPKQTKNAELFLVLDGIKQTDGTIAEHNKWYENEFLLQNKLYSRLAKVNAARHDLLKPTFGGYLFDARAKGFHNGYAQYDKDNLSNYRQIHSMVLNLGYSKSARKTITLNFNQVKNIKFKSVKLIAMPYNQSYDKQMAHLKQTGLKHLNVHQNNVTGTANNRQATTLVTSIPYSSGWKLTIDGNQAKTFVVNKGFVGAKLPAGIHHIHFHYTTPGLKFGTWLSTGSALVVLLLIIGTGFMKLFPQEKEPAKHASRHLKGHRKD
ncbi:YfhO family protein [Lentilactobacillus sp. G22-6]|uniref:YfhO family protein n=1 Tax=Lentilactobacillus dabitei TaxID=2831523 RepID=UPI001C25BB2A|nr:YfhO family protein [Lentilactobacillus dabitei]MBU9789494.1 YfhO family protein [Lentilactobacillus dabitei]